METFSKDVFEFREARIVYNNKDVGVGLRGQMVWEWRALEICLVMTDRQ